MKFVNISQKGTKGRHCFKAKPLFSLGLIIAIPEAVTLILQGAWHQNIFQTWHFFFFCHGFCIENGWEVQTSIARSLPGVAWKFRKHMESMW